MGRLNPCYTLIVDDLDTKLPTDVLSRNRPGEALKEWQVMEPIVRFAPGGNNQEIGIKAADGAYFPYLHGETTVFIKDGDSRKPMVRLTDGSQVNFDQWRATRREGVKSAIERVDVDVAFMYMEMLKDYPHLEQLDIDVATPDDFDVLRHTAGFWQRPKDDRTNPKIFVNAEPGKTNFETLFETREVSARIAAKLLGVSFEELRKRPDLLGLFIFFHEVGHADDFIQNYYLRPGSQDPSGENHRVRKAEMDSLSVPSSNPVVVREMYESGELEKYYTTYRDHYASLGIMSAEDLMQKHEAAYHDLPTEAFADRFAAIVLKKHASRLGFEPEDLED